MHPLFRAIGGVLCCALSTAAIANGGVPWGGAPADGLAFAEIRPDPDQPGVPSGLELMAGSVAVTTGNKVQQQLDFQTNGQAPLALIRTFNQAWDPSQKWPLAGIFGNLWVSNYDTKLAFENIQGEVTSGGCNCRGRCLNAGAGE